MNIGIRILDLFEAAIRDAVLGCFDGDPALLSRTCWASVADRVRAWACATGDAAPDLVEVIHRYAQVIRIESGLARFGTDDGCDDQVDLYDRYTEYHTVGSAISTEPTNA